MHYLYTHYPRMVIVSCDGCQVLLLRNSCYTCIYIICQGQMHQVYSRFMTGIDYLHYKQLLLVAL
jgi:hypothetical protein